MRFRTAALSLGITCGLLLIGLLVFAAVSSALPTGQTLLPWLGWALGWKVPIWAALLAWLAVWRPQTGLYIAAAAVAATLDILLSNLWFVTSGGLLFFLPGWALTITAFTGVAAIGCLLASGRIKVAPIAIALVLTIGGALALSFPYQWFAVYFTIGGPPPRATDAEADKYLATVLAAVALITAAVVLAAVQRRRPLTVLAAVLLALTLLLGFVFQVPQGRWVPRGADPQPYNSNYVPCYGEGDPNCVGG